MKIRYQYSNHLGSASLELNDAGEFVSYQEYFPFGETAYTYGTVSTEYRFTGKERDEFTGLYYFGARYYASWLGRWMNPDPSGPVDGLNVFVYVSNRPIVMVDPNGRKQEKSGLTKWLDKNFVENPEAYIVPFSPQYTVDYQNEKVKSFAKDAINLYSIPNRMALNFVTGSVDVFRRTWLTFNKPAFEQAGKIAALIPEPVMTYMDEADAIFATSPIPQDDVLMMATAGIRNLRYFGLSRYFDDAARYANVGSDALSNANKSDVAETVLKNVDETGAILKEFNVNYSTSDEILSKAKNVTISNVDDVVEAGKIKQKMAGYNSKLNRPRRTRGNSSFAEANVKGLDKSEYFAHSGIDNANDLDDALERIPELSFKPKDEIFKWSDELNAKGELTPREVDSEYKILSDIANRLNGNYNASGTITLVTDFKPCRSCAGVIDQFTSMFPNINVNVIHNNYVKIK